jgi:hypothetical protein
MLQHDRRYTIFDHAPEARERWLRVRVVTPFLSRLLMISPGLSGTTLRAEALCPRPRDCIKDHYCHVPFHVIEHMHSFLFSREEDMDITTNATVDYARENLRT